MKISEIMSTDVAVIRPRHTVAQAAAAMEEQKVGILPVVSHDDRLLGLVTDRDITIRCDAYGKDPNIVTVEDIMSDHVVFCYANDDVLEAGRTMAQHHIRRLPVLDRVEPGLVGLVSVDDLAGISSELDEVVDRILQEAVDGA